MKINFFGTIIIALMITLSSCAPSRNTTVVRQHPKVIVVNKPGPNKKVKVLHTNQNRVVNRGRGGRVVVIR